MIINFMTNTLISKMLLVCQMSVTKPRTNMGFSKGLYINVKNLCKFFTRYTSYEVMYIDSEVTHHD